MLGISLREFSHRAEISPAYLQDLMHGRGIPSLETAGRLVLASGGRITVEDIMAWKRKPAVG